MRGKFADMSLWEVVVYLYESHTTIFVLGVFMAIDIATGVCAAYVTKTLSSKTGMTGMVRKVIVMLLVAMAAAMERMQPDVPLAKLVCTFFMLVEGLSILENAKRAGVPIPDALSSALNTAKGPAVEQRVHLEIKGAQVDATMRPEDIPQTKTPRSTKK